MKIKLNNQKKWTIAALIMGASAFQNSLAAPNDKTIQDLCNELNKATFEKNFQKALELTYPKLVAQVGKDKLIEMLNDTVAGKPDFRITGIECEIPTQHRKVDNIEFALIPVTTIATVKGGTFRHPGSYLAISNNTRACYESAPNIATNLPSMRQTNATTCSPASESVKRS